MGNVLDGSLLRDPEALPLCASDVVRSFGSTLVVAPHPDDESLGCGGAIALLRAAGLPVRVLIVSDGAASHPNSVRYPPPRLRALREREELAALAALGVSAGCATFLRLPDTRVPGADEAGFAEAVAACRALLARYRVQTVLAPWRREPHCDHRAASAIARAALAVHAAPVRLLEYPIWTWTLAGDGDAPASGESRGWRLCVRDVAPRKLAAIAAHRSQTTNLIDDDAAGFRLLPEQLALFARPWELFLEAAAS